MSLTGLIRVRSQVRKDCKKKWYLDVRYITKSIYYKKQNKKKERKQSNKDPGPDLTDFRIAPAP